MTRNPPRVPQAVLGLRFRVVWTNGVWTIFDRHTTTHGRALNTRKQADGICADLNAKEAR